MQKFSNELVKEINRLYHEEEAEIYDANHPEIFERETGTWQRLAGYLPTAFGGRRIVDVGSGTGFVYAVLMPYLTSRDTFVFTDISPAMLEQARKKFAGRGPVQCEFAASNGETLPFPGATADAVTLNSVLHHLPGTERFLAEADRVLKPGGVLMIAHEPNRLFWKNPVLRTVSWILGKAQGAKKRLGNFSKERPDTTPLGSNGSYVNIYRAVNDALLQKKLISAPLSEEEIQSCVDVLSPTAMRIPDARKGFVPLEFFRRIMPRYRVCYVETSAHLGKFSGDASSVMVWSEKLLRTLFPRSGSSFAIVLQKL